MTDKQIKEGLDVSQCECYSVEDNSCSKTLSGSCMKEKCQTFRLLQTIKAKEQECEELKHEVELMMDCASCKVDEYKKTLAKIKEIAEPYKMTIKKICGNCKKYDDCHACCYKDINCYKYTSSKTDACEEFTYLDKFVPNILANNILQKISECKTENE